MSNLDVTLKRIQQYSRYSVQRLNRGAITVDNYALTLRTVARDADALYPETEYLSLDTEQLEAVLDERDIKPASRRNRVIIMRGFGRWAMMARHCEANNAAELFNPKPGEPNPKPMSQSEIDRLFLLCANPRTRLCIALGYFQGFRVSEMCRMEGDWINADSNTLRVCGKGGKWRTMPLSADVMQAVGHYGESLKAQGKALPTGGPLMLTQRGTPMKPHGTSVALTQFIRDCGINSTAHKLRHTFGTNVFRATRDLETARVALGHSDIKTTYMYVPEAGLSELRSAFDAMPTRINRKRVLDVSELIDR